MSKVIIITILSVLLVSCQDRKTKKEIQQLSSEAVAVPSGITQVLFGRDTTLLDVDGSPARLVIYTDSLSCSSCRLKYMFEYNDILGLHEELGGEFMPIFVFSPREGQSAEIRNTLLLYRFDYPILLDDRGMFPAANPHIPADNRFHTFLLDKNGKVVLVGNPVNNPGLWELYKTTITQLIENEGTMPIVEK
jgi:uncharacterized protein YcfL